MWFRKKQHREDHQSGENNCNTSGAVRVALVADWQDATRSAFKLFKRPLRLDPIEGAVAGTGIAICKVLHSGNNLSVKFQLLAKNRGWEVKKTLGRVKAEVEHDLLKYGSEADFVALVGGRPEYSRVVKLLKLKGVKLILLAMEETCAAELRSLADKFVPITRDMVLPPTNGDVNPRPADFSSVEGEPLPAL